MALLIHVDGASDGDRLRGVCAAWAVFDQAGVAASSCAWAKFLHDRANTLGPDAGRLSELVVRCSAVWNEAEQAGLKACCKFLPEVPVGSSMELPMADLLSGI